MSENPSNHKPKLDRRQLLSLLGASLTTAVLAGCRPIFKFPNTNDAETSNPTDTTLKNLLPTVTIPAPSPVSTPLPQEGPPGPSLHKTATAIAEKGSTTSFVEDREYSEAFFAEVRNATFIVEIFGEKNGRYRHEGGTAFAIKNWV